MSRMKDNWHGSIERYMLNEDDLRIYSLLFREMEYSINRMEANDKIYMMNRKLQEAAVTDMLTGIYNRAGMYEEIQQIIYLDDPVAVYYNLRSSLYVMTDKVENFNINAVQVVEFEKIKVRA